VDKASAFFDEPFPAQDLPVSQDVRGTILLGELATQEAVLRDEAGKVEVCLNFDHSTAYRFLVLWSPTPDAPFYCIEPWTALPNSMGRSDGELVFLEPGARFEAGLWMEVRTLS
jgi:galactose mutarotase-like enzyme